MRILHANLACGFRGGERQTLLLAEALREKGINQKLLLARGSRIPDICIPPGNLIHRPSKYYVKDTKVILL